MPEISPPASKGARTSQTIVEVAERLWGERGIDAVSLREISAAAGLSNPASVQYHFGGRDQLVAAIYERRLPAIDARRRYLLDEAFTADAAAGLRTLLSCLFRPLFEQVDSEGKHSYASFLRQVLQFAPAARLREQSMHLTPATAELLRLIDGATPDMPPALAAHRLIAANLMMLDVVVKIDREPSELGAEAVFGDTLDMLAAALALPPSLQCSP